MEQIEECISFLVGKAHQQVNQAAKQRLAPYGVTPVQFAVLHGLWQRDGQSGAELSERLLLDSATMTGILDRLAAAGLIERRPDSTDRRINRVVLTERGRALQAPLNREMDEMNDEFFGRFSAEDAARLRALLAELGNVEVV
jgi:DNA-binding MarR family transcriptional regulator